jgi:hypothetical protein
MNDQGMLKPAMIGGVLLGILSALPVLNCACCAWIIGGGMLAANLYVKISPSAVKLSSGVALGLLTGAIGGVVTTLFSIPVQYLLKDFIRSFASSMQQQLGEVMNLPAETRQAFSAMLANSGNLTVLSVVFAGFFNLIIFSMIAMLGGILGVAIFEKRKIDGPIPAYQPAIHMPPPPPPPPSEEPPERGPNSTT